MNRYEFIDKLVTEIKDVPISEVLALYDIDLYRNGSTGYRAYSPFREESSGHSFTICDNRGIFKDWTIEEYAGDSIYFVALMEGVSYFNAIPILGLKLGILSKNEYNHYFHNRKFRVNYQNNIKKKFNIPKNNTKNKSVKASVKDLDKVYRMFINRTKLNKEHLNHLIKERNLSKDDIKEDLLFSFPNRYMLRGFLADVEKEYGNTDILAKIPGFFKEIGSDTFTFYSTKGIGIPIMNHNKKIIGIQIRKDDLSDNYGRYMWFSSSFAINDANEKRELGTGSGSPMGVIYPDKIEYPTIFITEGYFKAKKIANTFNCVAITVQGVGNWAGINSLIKDISKRIGMSFKYLYVAYDVDMKENSNVFEQAMKMTNSIKSIDSNNIYYLSWNRDLGKGIDDMMNNCDINNIHPKYKIYKYNKNIYDKDYMLFKEYLLNKFNVTHIGKIKQSDVLEEYMLKMNKYVIK